MLKCQPKNCVVVYHPPARPSSTPRSEVQMMSGLEYKQRPGCKVGVTKSKGMVAVGAFLWLVCAPGRLGRNRSSSFAIPRAAILVYCVSM